MQVQAGLVRSYGRDDPVLRAGYKRLDASIAVAEGKTDDAEQFTCEAVKAVSDFTPTTGKNFYYFIRKYYHPPYQYVDVLEIISRFTVMQVLCCYWQKTW